MTTEEQDAQLGRMIRELSESRNTYEHAKIKLDAIGQQLMALGKKLASGPEEIEVFSDPTSNEFRSLIMLNPESIKELLTTCHEARNKGEHIQRQLKTLTGRDF